MRSIGIDIGNLSIKIADVELAGRNVILRDFHEIPFVADISMDKKIQIIDALRKISSHYDPFHTKFVVGVSQDRISIRNKVFPFREKLKINKSLPFELEDEIPFDQDKAVFDAKIIKFSGQSSQVLACACMKKYIAEVIQLTNDAGFDPDIVSTDGFALANLFTDWWSSPPEAESLSEGSLMIKVDGNSDLEKPSTPAELYLHLGHTKTILMVLQNQYLIETRSINMGGMEIVKGIQKTYEISYADALKGLQDKGFVLTKNDGASKDQVTFSNTIQKALTPLLLEVKKTILELESEYQISIQNVHLLGGVSHLINIAPYFTQKLGVVSNPLNHLTSGIRVYASQTNELLKDSAIAIGLAIEGIKRPKNPPINFRKGELAKDGASASAFLQKWKKTFQYAAAALVLFAVFSYTRDIVSTSLTEKADDALVDVARSPSIGLKGSQASTTNIQKFIREKNKEISDYQKLSDLKMINSPLDIINKITTTIPPKRNLSLDIREFNVRSEFINLQGEISSQDQLNTLKSLLRNISIDKKLTEAPATITSKDGRLTFNFSFKMDRKAQR